MINKVMYRKIDCDILRVCLVEREIGEGEEWSRRVRERRQIPSLVGDLEGRLEGNERWNKRLSSWNHHFIISLIE